MKEQGIPAAWSSRGPIPVLKPVPPRLWGSESIPVTVLLAEEGQHSSLAFAPRSPHAQPFENKRPCFFLVFFICFNLLLGWEGNSSRSSEDPLILSLAEMWGDTG